MCGFSVLFHRANARSDDCREIVRQISKRLAVRGPDSQSILDLPGVSMTHSRLAIVDPSPSADQPMFSQCKRFVVVFNGEIYNYFALKKMCEAKGTLFRTQCDTEVLLELYIHFGHAAFNLLEGMYTLIILDIQNQSAVCVRDPYGIKPLYFLKSEYGLIFSSTVSSLEISPLNLHLSESSFDFFCALGYVPETTCVYKEITPVKSGHMLIVKSGQIVESTILSSTAATIKNAAEAKFIYNASEFIKTAVRESILRHTLSDVPIGVFLSGGVDSSVIASVCAEIGPETSVTAITLEFEEFYGQVSDEVPRARLVAKQLGISHYVRRISIDEFKEDFPSIMRHMDQPSIDGINTWFASKAAAELGIKVCLTGAGADELFNGYSSFKLIPKANLLGSYIRKIPFACIILILVGRLLGFVTKNRKWLDLPLVMEGEESCWLLYRSVTELSAVFGREPTRRLWFSCRGLVRSSERLIESVCDTTSSLESHQIIRLLETEGYLKNQLLRDADWAGMAHGVEVRVPFADFKLLLQMMSCSNYIHQADGKKIIAEIPRAKLPDVVVATPKTGFGIPVHKWFKRLETRNNVLLSWVEFVKQEWIDARK